MAGVLRVVVALPTETKTIVLPTTANTTVAHIEGLILKKLCIHKFGVADEENLESLKQEMRGFQLEDSGRRLGPEETIEGRQLKYRIPTDGEDEDGEQLDVSLTLAIGAREEKLDLTVPENANVRDLQTAIAERMCQDRHGTGSGKTELRSIRAMLQFCILETPKGVAYPARARVQDIMDDGIVYRNHPPKKKRTRDRVYYEPSVARDEFPAISQLNFSSYFALQDDELLEKGTLKDCVTFLTLVSRQANQDNTDLFSFFGYVWKVHTPEEVLEVTAIVWRNLSEIADLAGYITQRMLNFLEQCRLLPYDGECIEEFNKGLKVLAQEECKLGDRLNLVLNRKRNAISMLHPLLSTSAVSETLVSDHNFLIRVPPEELADQLTLDEARLFRSVNLLELWNLRWQKDPDQAPNVCAIASHFTLISNWVAHVILLSEQQKDFVKIYRFFTKVIRRLMALRNYSTAAQICFALTSPNVTRVKRFMEKVPMKLLALVEEHRDTFGGHKNFAAYRSLDHSAPFIPFLAVYQRDLVYHSEGTETSKEFLNMAAIRAEGRIIMQTKLHHASTTDYTDVLRYYPRISEALSKITPITDDELYDLSLERQPVRLRSRSDSPSPSPRAYHASPPTEHKFELSSSVEDVLRASASMLSPRRMLRKKDPQSSSTAGSSDGENLSSPELIAPISAAALPPEEYLDIDVESEINRTLSPQMRAEMCYVPDFDRATPREDDFTGGMVGRAKSSSPPSSAEVLEEHIAFRKLRKSKPRSDSNLPVPAGGGNDGEMKRRHRKRKHKKSSATKEHKKVPSEEQVVVPSTPPSSSATSDSG